MGHRVSGIHRFILANKRFIPYVYMASSCLHFGYVNVEPWLLCIVYSIGFYVRTHYFSFYFFLICLIGMLSCPQEYCTYIVGGNSGPSAGCCEFLLNAIGEKASIT